MPEFSLVDHAPLSPSHCVFCAGNKPPLIDTKIAVRGGPLGRLYVCRFCFETMAALHGYVSPERVRQYDEVNQRLSEKIDELLGELDVLRPLGAAVENLTVR